MLNYSVAELRFTKIFCEIERCDCLFRLSGIGLRGLSIPDVWIPCPRYGAFRAVIKAVSHVNKAHFMA